jgi:hypothetical protein
VISRHNEIRDELIHMAGKAMTPSAICDEPLIKPGCIAEKTTACPTTGTDFKSNKENKVSGESNRGDLLLRGFWTLHCGRRPSHQHGHQIILQEVPSQSPQVRRKAEEVKVP